MAGQVDMEARCWDILRSIGLSCTPPERHAPGVAGVVWRALPPVRPSTHHMVQQEIGT